MARHKRATGLEQDEPGLEISSLIDICFLLLIYFLVTTTLQRSEMDSTMSIPSSAPSETPSDIKPMFIRVAGDDVIYTGTGSSEQALDRNDPSDPNVRNVPLLDQRVDSYKTGFAVSGKDPVVQLYIEGDASYQRTVDVINCLRKHAIKNVAFTDLTNN